MSAPDPLGDVIAHLQRAGVHLDCEYADLTGDRGRQLGRPLLSRVTVDLDDVPAMRAALPSNVYIGSETSFEGTLWTDAPAAARTFLAARPSVRAVMTLAAQALIDVHVVGPDRPWADYTSLARDVAQAGTHLPNLRARVLSEMTGQIAGLPFGQMPPASQVAQTAGVLLSDNLTPGRVAWSNAATLVLVGASFVDSAYRVEEPNVVRVHPPRAADDAPGHDRS